MNSDVQRLNKMEVSQKYSPAGHGTIGTRDNSPVETTALEHQDPRPDLVNDTDAWHVLLSMAYPDATNPAGLYGLLRGMRSLGAGLRRGNTTWQLVPGHIDPDEYNGYRNEWIAPHRERLSVLLREMMLMREAA